MGIKAVLLAIFPLTFAATLFAPEWMALWLGADYAARGVRVAQILSIGVLINCLAYLPFTLLQALGRADLTAKTHLAELPVYVALLAVLTAAYGIEGAALAWSIRCAVDAAVLFLMARRLLPSVQPVLSTAQQLTCVLFFVFMFGALLPGGPEWRGLYLTAVMLVFGSLGWLVLLTAEERRLARHPGALLAGGVSR
jgi:O-antigen/teichoic acid export membrane protein